MTEPAAQKVCQNEKPREAWYAVGIRNKYVLRRQYKRQYEHGNNFKNDFEYGTDVRLKFPKTTKSIEFNAYTNTCQCIDETTSNVKYTDGLFNVIQSYVEKN